MREAERGRGWVHRRRMGAPRCAAPRVAGRIAERPR